MTKKPVGIVFAFALFLGCSGTTDPYSNVTVVPSKGVYMAGELVTADIVNGSNETIGYGACALRLERREGSSWVLVGPEQLPCIDILYILESNATATRQVPIDKSSPAGTYRVRATIFPGTHLPTRDIRSAEVLVRDAD